MKLRLKFLIPLTLIMVTMSVIVVYVVNSHIREDALRRAQEATANHVFAMSREKLSPENFRDPDFSRQRAVFEAFMNRIKTPEIIKIKAFNSRFDIIYSTKVEDIGKKTDSNNYRVSLHEGKVLSAIKPPVTEGANIDMLGYRQVMEVYVPIIYSGAVEGVVEAYFKMDAVNDTIQRIQKNVIALIALFSVAALAIMYLLLSFIIVRPLNAIKETVDRISGGQKDAEVPFMTSRDEIGDLTRALRKLLVPSGAVWKK